MAFEPAGEDSKLTAAALRLRGKRAALPPVAPARAEENEAEKDTEALAVEAIASAETGELQPDAE